MRERERKREREKSLSRFDDTKLLRCRTLNPLFFAPKTSFFPSNLLPKNESNALSIISITDLRV